MYARVYMHTYVFLATCHTEHGICTWVRICHPRTFGHGKLRFS